MARPLRFSFAFSAVIGAALLVGACGGAIAPDGTPSGDAPPSATGTTPGGSGSTPGSPGDPDVPPKPGSTCGGDATSIATCKAPIPIPSEKELTTAIASLEWPTASGDRPARLSPTADLFFASDTELDAKALPPSCSSGFACHGPLYMVHDGDVPGVRCLETVDSSFGRKACARVHVDAGTTMRLLLTTEDHHPAMPIYWPTATIIASCAMPCAATELRCAATQLCLSAGPSFCTYCQGLAPETCACRDDHDLTCGAKDEGATCGYATSPDTYFSGKCLASKCTPTR